MERFGNPIRTEFRQRKYDGKWELNGLFKDHRNAYTYNESSAGGKITLTPELWVTMRVYDYLIDLVG